jgi:hypothetical protein
MPRYRRGGDDIAQGIAGLVVLLALLFTFQPRLAQTIIGFLLLVVLIVVLIAVAVIVIKLFRHGTSSTKLSSFHFKTSPRPAKPYQAIAPVVAVAPPEPTSPRTVTGADLRAMDWFQFERVIATLYESRGNRVERRGGANADGGIDLVLYRNEKRAAVQCKHWRVWKVRIRDLREFFGAMKVEGFDQGLYVTLQGCTRDARNFAEEHGIKILDSYEVEGMLTKTSAEALAQIRSIIDDPTKHCPKCGAPMVVRTARRGLNYGSQFWACSRFPLCRGKMRLTD